ncbi:MAG: GGDEF domain-containing protein [Frankiaceae bacterium]|nr:GGDEF domain-containing protein [Frankiaceae bacterium]
MSPVPPGDEAPAVVVPTKPAHWERLVTGRPPQHAGRIQLLILAIVAAMAHVPGWSALAMSLGLVLTLLVAIWAPGRVAYAWVAAAQLVQLQLGASALSYAATAGAVALALGTTRAVRALTTVVSASQQATLRQYGARDELARRSKAEHEELSGQVAYWSSHDRLTQLLNRTAVNQHLAAVAATGAPCGILVVSLAGFSAVNEALGADVGDECLAALAARLHSRARDTDLVGRLGGDEFAIVLPGLTAEHAGMVAQRLLTVLGDPFTVGPHTVLLHARSGLALNDGSFSGGPSDLVRQASMASRSARIGAEAAVFSAATQAEQQAAVSLEADLHRALERDEFFLLYQPLVSTTTGQIESLEALVRWQHPERGLVPPDQFIGAAERTGQIVGIGIRVLEMAVAQLKAWTNGLGSSLTVAVNVSARQLSEPDFVEKVQSVIWAAGVDPHRVILELTESMLVEDSEVAIAASWRLRSLGFRLALDDFGTGYSSLARLGELPLDELKIDKSFVDRLGVGPTDSTALVTAAIAMGHGLGLTVVAEGVETHSQAAHLTSLSCDLLQGYWLGRPQTVEALTPQFGQNLVAQAGIPAPREDSVDAAPAGLHVPQLVPDSARR